MRDLIQRLIVGAHVALGHDMGYHAYPERVEFYCECGKRTSVKAKRHRQPPNM